MRGRGTDRAIEWLKSILEEHFELTWEEPKRGDSTDFLGENWEYAEDGGSYIDQDQYIEHKVREAKLGAGRWKFKEKACTEEETKSYRSSLGGLAWVSGRTRPEINYETSAGASKASALRIGDVIRLNKVVRYVRQSPKYRIFMPALKCGKMKIVVVVDAGEGEQQADHWSKAQTGFVIGLQSADLGPGEEGTFVPLIWRSGKCRRVTHSSFDAEVVAAVEALDTALAIAMLLEEFEDGVRPSRREHIEETMEEWYSKDGEQDFVSEKPRSKIVVEMHTDSNSMVSKVKSVKLDAGMSKRRKCDIGDLKECLSVGDVSDLVFVAGPTNPADSLTKHRSRTTTTTRLLIDLVSSGWYKPHPQ